MKNTLFALLLLPFVANASPVFMASEDTIETIDISQLLFDPDPDAVALFALYAAGSDVNTSPRLNLNFDGFTSQVFSLVGDQLQVTEVDISLGGGFNFQNLDTGGNLTLPTNEFEIGYFDTVASSWMSATTWENVGPNTTTLVFDPVGGFDAGLILTDAFTGDPSPGLPIDTVPVTTPVPIPAAGWLFGAGLIGMVGVARRK